MRSSLCSAAAQSYTQVALEVGLLLSANRPAVEWNGTPLDAARALGSARRSIRASPMSGDAVVRRRHMGDIRISFTRHMTANAIVVAATLQSDRGRKAAPAVAVALQAATPVIGRLLLE